MQAQRATGEAKKGYEYEVIDRDEARYGVQGVYGLRDFQSPEHAVHNLPEVYRDERDDPFWLQQLVHTPRETEGLRRVAREHIQGVREAMKVGLPQQALCHVEALVQYWNLNKSLAAERGLREQGFDAKVFGKISAPRARNRMSGPDWGWDVLLLEGSGICVPTRYLGGVTQLHESGLRPESMWIGKPEKANKRPAREVAAQDLRAAGEVASSALALSGRGFRKMLDHLGESMSDFTIELKDPVLLAGYGWSPVFLVEIGRWE